MSQTELASKSVRELRAILTDRGVDYSDCIEKSDLVKKIEETAHLEPKAGTVRTLKQKIGDLNCIIIQNSNDPASVVILSHGYGANAEDLSSIATSVLQIPGIKEKPFKFVLPYAPITLGTGSYGWWPVDFLAVQERARTGNLEAFMVETPRGLPEARKKLLDFVLELKKEHPKLPWSKFVMGGFSQGAILSVDVSLHLPENIGAVVAWSGALMCKPEWEKLAPAKKHLKVIQTHGTQDPILPYGMGKGVEELLKRHEIDVDFSSFQGGHSIPQQAIEKFVKLLQTI